MMNIKDIKYLALEGGGGKGVAYLGPIKVLEEHGLIPLGNANPNDNHQIKGIAGSSAGAITTLLLAIGMNAEEIKAEVNAEEGGFGDFMDEPHSGVYKAVYPDEKDSKTPVVGYAGDQALREKILVGKYRSIDDKEIATRVKGGPNRREHIFYKLMKSIGFLGLKKLLQSSSNPAVKRMTKGRPKELQSYLWNLLHDRGMFPGFAVREYFVDIMARHLPNKYPAFFDDGPDAHEKAKTKCRTLSFKELSDMTGLQIKTASVNNSLSKPVYFSNTRTPRFPVAEAVAMAMAIPGAFKPIYNSFIDFSDDNSELTRINMTPEDYHGLFVDGGTIRNLPIHAFDESLDGKMNKGVFGIRLTGGLQPKDDIQDVTRDISTKENIEESVVEARFRLKGLYKKDSNGEYYQDYPGFMQSPLGEWVGSIFNSLMYYSEQGQIRNLRENAQVLELYTYSIGVFDFTPEAWETKYVVEVAKDKTNGFIRFNQNNTD